MGETTDDIDYSQCQGRIFRRKEAFLSLPSTLQEDAKQCELYLTAHKDETFSARHHPPLMLKSVYGCKARELIHMILGWLCDVRVSGSKIETQEELKQYAHDIVDALLLDGFVAPLKDSENKPSTLSRSNSISLQAPPQSAAGAVNQDTCTNDVEGSAQADAPNTEKKPETKDSSSPESTAVSTKTYLFRENDVLTPVVFSDATRVSVWDVADGAIFAGFLKRKAGIFATFTQGKDVYVIVNERKKALYLFEGDTARGTSAIFELKENSQVQMDATFFDYGINIWNGEVCVEVLNGISKDTQQQCFDALLQAGASAQEAIVKSQSGGGGPSFYELSDMALGTKEIITMDRYKGKVVLVVNVATKSNVATVNFQDLVYLHDKYHAQGLAILAFPCNQFGGNEPGSATDIANAASQYTATFQFFEKGDVNGAEARPVFNFLKAKLPDTFGQFIKWDFAKFLIDREGNPVSRYAPKQAPKSLEPSIKKLLFGENSPDSRATTELPADIEVEGACKSVQTDELEKSSNLAQD
uniref:Glutathione peroxidase n=1 Tax=Albugo laibachii Nc14 TaxID=890382 RepID=F0WIW0_9STRA|nr:phospholipid hydroperoxide glutathione peroxidase pu [Albugo laibachii Nc14]|eukprot:CCA21206.1 phospholipid hydroperoxide glutathione peroxidase pu [Albugo laibachii Nc14]